MPARPIYHSVHGAPYQPGDAVRVACAIDPEVLDLSRRYIGKRGRVAYLEYDCGSGQKYPGDPMIGVVFADGLRQEFWREELEAS